MYKHVFAVFAVLAPTLFALAACGESNPPPATPAAGEHGEHGEHGGKHGEQGGKNEHHRDLAPPVHAFHEVLAPLWHLEQGPDRTAKTCAQSATLRDKATATADAELIAATTSLVAECEKEGRPEFDARFAAVHHRFHALAEAK